MSDLPFHPAWELGNLLDVRPPEQFAAAHLSRAASLPLPATDLAMLDDPSLREALPSYVLPPRREPLLVLAGVADLALAIREHLRRRGRAATDGAVTDAAALAAARLGLPAGSVVGGESARRLWRPPSFLSAHASLLPSPRVGPALDLGAGSGRAAVWLTERGFAVTAIDRLPEAVVFGRRLAAFSGVRCDFLQRDLRDPAQVPAGPWAVVLCLRFLHRPLLSRMSELLMPGGVVFVCASRTESPSAAGATAGPWSMSRARRSLAPGELRRLLSDAELEILAHTESVDEAGWAVTGCVGRRRGVVP